MIDLRSDTVTRPSEGMRRAIFEAEVGDDVFGEDPTVRSLERHVADLLGKEDALFVPSGVMGNQIAIRVHTQPGDEVVVAERSHIFHYESGAPALLSGVQLRPVGDPWGVVAPEDVVAVTRGAYDWEPRTSLVCLENTVNKSGGIVLTPEALKATAERARSLGLKTHLDGARLWNAAAALDCPEAEFAAPFDTVNVCFSKGLGAPVGSALAGTAAHMEQARRVRKLLGGGMRQADLLAAAARYALDHHRAGLVRDHERAAALAGAVDALADETGLFSRDPEGRRSNIVLFDTVPEADAVLAAWAEEGVQAVAFGPNTVRATLHRDITDDDLSQALDALGRVSRALA